MPLGPSVIDAPPSAFTFPVESEGSPSISVDEITHSRIITRSYAVKRALYQPLLLTPTWLVNDAQFPNAYLASENFTAERGSFAWLQRIFIEVPAPRTETRLIPFTRAGASAVQLSKFSGLPIGWNPYGAAAPNTRQVLASVAYSYATNASFAPIPAITRIYAGPAGNPLPVDYTGQVFAYQGNVSVTEGSQTISEPRWQLVGTTNPPFLPLDWIQDVQISRWRGPVWQMEVVTVSPP